MIHLVKDEINVKEIDMIFKNDSEKLVKVKQKIYKNVSRIFATSFNKNSEIIIDVNTKIFPISEGDNLDLLIAIPQMKSNNSIEQIYTSGDWNAIIEKELMEKYEYIMCGTVFHLGNEGDKNFFYASFGGLLMKYFGDLEKNVSRYLKLDSKILLFIEKI
jgi:hypothetical protein